MGIIRLLNPSDADAMFEWMQDPKITQWLSFDVGDKSLDDARHFIAKAMLTDQKNKHYAIQTDNEKPEYVGTISLKNINHEIQTAEYAIVICSKFQGQGYAKKASEWLLQEAISRFNLKTVYLTVMKDNQSAIHLYEKLGFIRDIDKDSILVKNGQEIIQYFYEKQIG